MVKKPNEPVEEKTFEVDEDGHLELIQGLVEGYVEIVRIGGSVIAAINEEGMYKDFEVNCGFLGTIVFLRENEDQWDSLTDEDLRKVKAWIVAHENDPHLSGPIQFLEGQAMIDYKNRLLDNQRKKEMEWNSF